MNSQPSRKGAICYLLRDDKIFLLRLRYPNGRVVWGTLGGMHEEKETFEETVIREAKEEVNITIHKSSLKKVAIVQETEKFQLIVFTATEWEGEPEILEDGIEEARWFSLNEIPYEMMWPDNRFWFPKILEGKSLKVEVGKDIYEVKPEEIKENDVIVKEYLTLD